MRKTISMRLLTIALIIICLQCSIPKAFGQDNALRKGTVERIKVHGKGLEGNLSGDSPDREVSIYLPPGYKANPKRRYPVVYFLHGFTDNDAQWYGLQPHWINLPSVINKALASGQLGEMIFVTPNAYTRFKGSFYANSVTTGNWEEFVAKELVTYIDNHYRTIPQAASRGLAGHSMGGYGAWRIGQKYAHVFSSLYLLSPCCLTVSAADFENLQAIPRLDSIQTQADFDKANFGIWAAFATGAAWSPNPKKPPFFLDLPVEKGKIQAVALAKRIANMPISTLDQNISSIRKLKAIAFDVGTKDDLAPGLKVLNEQLNNYGIKHSYEGYEGDHLNRIAERIETKMLSFFSKNLSFQTKQP